MPDVYAVRKVYTEQKMSNADFAESNQNISDSLLKRTYQETLPNVIKSMKMSTEVG